MDQRSNIIFVGGAKVTGLPPASANGEAATFEQLQSALDGFGYKDNVRVAAPANINLASPGVTIDGITMAIGDRVLFPNQITVAQNGIFLYNGPTVPMTRTADADSFNDLESAVVRIDEGTAAGQEYRQTQVNGVIDTDDILFIQTTTAAAIASETVSGITELATQDETDVGIDDLRIVTPLKLATYSGRPKRYSQSFGDGTANQYDITHNFATTDINAVVRKVIDGAKVSIDWRALDANTIRINSVGAIAATSLRVTITA
jgi:hypothetical protein